MAEITTMSAQGPRDRSITPTTLGASDTLTYVAGSKLYIFNDTAGAITPNIDGADAPTALEIKGGGTKDLSSGHTMDSIGVGKVAMIPLDTIKEFLAGVITVTGGDGAEAWIETP